MSFKLVWDVEFMWQKYCDSSSIVSSAVWHTEVIYNEVLYLQKEQYFYFDDFNIYKYWAFNNLNWLWMFLLINVKSK